MVEPNPAAPPRVAYLERQRLRFGDLRDEQAYREDQRRHHLVAAHGWGIVAGLEIEVVGAFLALSPGLAVDGHGRELIVPRRVEVALADLPAAGPLAGLDLWLLYGQRELKDGTRHGHEARLRVVAAAGDHGNPSRRPREPREWPVYLGRLAPAGDSYTALAAGRRQTPAIGGHLAGGGVRLDLVDEDARQARFAVHVSGNGDGDDEPDTRVGDAKPCWTIDREGRSRIDGRLRISGALAVTAGEAPPALRWAAPAPTEEAAAPADDHRRWRIQRHRLPGEGGELRIQLESPAERTAVGLRLAIGTAGDKGAFQPCLRASADGSVEVAGHLVVEGRLLESSVRADVDDERFRRQLVERRADGLDAALVQSLKPQAAPAKLAVRKISSVVKAAPGSRVTYAYYVANTGDVDLTVDITDSFYGPIRRAAAAAPGETLVVHRNFEVPDGTGAGETGTLEAGILETTVTAHGRDADGRTATDDDRHVLRLDAPDDLELLPGLGRLTAHKLETAMIASFATLAATPVKRLARIVLRHRETLELWRQAAAQHQASGLATFSQVAATPLPELEEKLPAYASLDLGAWQEEARERADKQQRRARKQAAAEAVRGALKGAAEKISEAKETVKKGVRGS